MFYGRENEKKQILDILKEKSTHIHFIYGPINSGKTNLIRLILENLPKEYVPFYNNFRWRDVSNTGDFLNVLFNVDRETKLHNIGKFLGEFLKGSSEIIGLTTGIPIPLSIFELLFQKNDKGDDAFKYLFDFFVSLTQKKLKPVFILDELQVINEIANSNGNLLIEKLFNFLVGLTKETHLCHCFVISSDSVFIEQVYGNARLEGRSKYILVDDLDQGQAFEMYDNFGLTENKELVWDTIGGKIGDMVLLGSDIKLGFDLEESISKMLSGQTLRLEMIDARLYEKDENECKEKMDFLFQVEEKGQINFKPRQMRKNLKFWVEKNVLFFDPVKKIIKPQSQLIRRGIKELMKS